MWLEFLDDLVQENSTQKYTFKKNYSWCIKKSRIIIELRFYWWVSKIKNNFSDILQKLIKKYKKQYK